MDKSIQTTIKNLEKNNLCAYFAETKKDVIPLLKNLLGDGCSVSVGGSVTLSECGIPEFLKTGDYNYIDRYDPALD